MSEVEELEQRIKNLPPQAMAQLRDWFLALDNERWDDQIAADVRAGKFKDLIERAQNELAQGQAHEL